MKISKGIVVLLCLFILTGCATVKEIFIKPLAKLNDEECVYDVRDEFNPYSVLIDVQEGVDVTYEINEETSKAIITLVKENKTEVLEKDLTLLYPLGELLQTDIDYYTYKAFDDKLYISLAEDVSYETSINLEAKTIDYILTKGDREETYTANLDIINPLSSHELISFKKGGKNTMSRLILDGIEYCVFSIDGNEALLLSMDGVIDLPFNDALSEDASVNPFISNAAKEALGDFDHNGIKDEYDGIIYNYYENCTIDKYLENEFYQSMSQELKDAIVEKTIIITNKGGTFDHSYIAGTIDRHVYLGDVSDWEGISVSKVFNTFVSQSILLRSQCSYMPIASWDIWSFVGNSDYWNIIFNGIAEPVRPMFAVDTTKLPETVLID